MHALPDMRSARASKAVLVQQNKFMLYHCVSPACEERAYVAWYLLRICKLYFDSLHDLAYCMSMGVQN